MYEFKTTFWMDFSIADKFGTDAIKDTYKRAFNEWKFDVVYITELVIVLNWKTFFWWENHNEEYFTLYDSLWARADRWCMKNLKGSDLDYYLRTTD